MLYPTLKFLCKTAVQSYFSKIEFNGEEHIPIGDVPVIFAANHRSAFLDAILLAVFSKEPIHFLARADVFSGALGRFLEAINMMPIYRIRDRYKNLSRNDMVFEKCSKILKAKKRLLIFPEGSQEDLIYLRPLTKGIARIALNTQSEMDTPIIIIPLGINYFNAFHSGHKLCFNYGKPIQLKSFMQEFDDHNNKAYKSILDTLSNGIKQQLYIEEPSDDYEKKTFALNRGNENIAFDVLKAQISNNTFRQESKFQAWSKWLKYLLYIPNLPAVGILVFILTKLTTNRHFTSSMKIAFGALIFPLWLLISFLTVLSIFNIKWAMIVLLIQYTAMYFVPKVSRLERI